MSQGNQIGAAGMQALAESPNLAGLEMLDLHTLLGADGGRALAASPHLRQLRTLLLFGCKLGDDGVKALAASPVLATLQTLNLCDNDLTDEAARALAASPYLQQLGKMGLVLHHNVGLTDAGVQALRERFSDEQLSMNYRGMRLR